MVFGKVPLTSTGKGFITQMDRYNGLDFFVVAQDDTHLYVIAKCDVPANLVDWGNRVGATQMTKADFKTAVGALIPFFDTCSMGFTHDNQGARVKLLEQIEAWASA